MKTTLRLLCIAAVAVSAAACGSNGYVDLDYFGRFVQHNTPAAVAPLEDVIDLYVDYSTCVSEAKSSEFYRATHPAIVDCSPNYYSIKGNSITLETSDRQQVYALLNTVREVNNADIKAAVHQIVTSNHQAVLITDGEYYLRGSVHDNLTNPYLAEDFRTWMRDGHDIYIYSEPYIESGRWEKYRYYMIFTDDDIDDNLNAKFVRSAPESEDVLVLHMSTHAPTVSFDRKYPVINEAIKASIIEHDATPGVDFIDNSEGFSWSDIQNYLTSGNINDDFILRGITVNRLDADCYKIESVVPVVYQCYDEFQVFADSAAVEGSLPTIEGQLREVRDIFEIDARSFTDNGELVLKIHKNFDGMDLANDHMNLLKVDFVIDEAKDNFSNNDDLNRGFQWTSISSASNHALNTSLYQSIRQVLSQPAMNPAKRKEVIYTVYIAMPAFN